MSWKETTLENHVDLISGPAFKSAKFSDNHNDIPLIKGENLSQQKILWEKSRYWSVNEVAGYEKYFLEEGDVVLAMDRPWVPAGLKYAWIQKTDPKSLLVQRVARLKGINGLSTDFLRYIIGSQKFSQYIKGIMGGTNVPHISGDQIKAFQFQLPSQTEQKRIVSILSPYDDLIENNRRRIQLLEEAARLLYQEWFVRLRFPGHEHTKIVDGVPEGWTIKTAYEVMDICSGGTPKTSITDYWNGDIPFFTPKDVKDNLYALITDKNITENGLKNCNSKLYPKDTIFITARGTVGKTCLAQTDMAMNQSCYALISKKPLTQYFLLFALREGISQIQNRAVGSVFDAIIVDTFKLIPFLVPSEYLIQLFSDNIATTIHQIDTLILQNNKLREARDLLLPRLMNGVIPV